MEAFDLSNLEQVIEQDARDAMMNVILSWARLDSFISKWMSVAFGTSPDATVILMGNMDTRNKLDKLKALYLHFGLAEGAASVERLKKAHGDHVDIRNAIAHSSCVGRIRSDPKKIAFTSIRRVKDKPGHTFVDLIPIDQMDAATAFAAKACDQIMEIIQAVKEPLSQPNG